MNDVRLIQVKEEIHADNERVARDLRARLTATHTYLLNVMASPGAGKTQTILATIEALRGHLRFGVLEADIDSTVDAEQVAARGISAVQLHTGGLCHLDAAMVEQGLAGLELDDIDVVVLENVGNLVCPAEFDTGAHKNIAILSVPEGDDKPLKYPLMFSVIDVLLVNKIDYLALSDFDVPALRQRVQRLNPRVRIFEISAKTGVGVREWASWLADEVKRALAS